MHKHSTSPYLFLPTTTSIYSIRRHWRKWYVWNVAQNVNDDMAYTCLYMYIGNTSLFTAGMWLGNASSHTAEMLQTFIALTVLQRKITEVDVKRMTLAARDADDLTRGLLCLRHTGTVPQPMAIGMSCHRLYSMAYAN